MIAILGAGKMGEALISGLLRAGRNPVEVLAVVRRPERAAQLRETYGVETVAAADAAKAADTLVITVKPQDMSVLQIVAGLRHPASPVRRSGGSGVGPVTDGYRGLGASLVR